MNHERCLANAERPDPVGFPALVRPVLLVDAAQEMHAAVPAELRLLTSTELDSRSILTVVLAGETQPRGSGSSRRFPADSPFQIFLWQRLVNELHFLQQRRATMLHRFVQTNINVLVLALGD